jgi:Ca2+-transporting ATPase
MKGFQQRGMRTLGLAMRPVSDVEAEIEPQARELTWVGFVAISDPVRPEVPGAVRACQSAGIGVKIVTGDTADTAREIGRQIGLLSEQVHPGAEMTGAEFGAMTDEEAARAVQDLRVLSRARPMDKLRLVKLLKDQNHVVAVTGDGTNDAPALNHADVGLAMGKTGTAVAKEAADIILLDDSFSSIVNAVMWGRSLYLNIQRFILFQLTINVAALGVALLGPFVGVDLPLTVMQMLWVNLIMDTFAALALATEPPTPSVLRNPPRDAQAFIITPLMTRLIFGVGGAFLAVMVGFLLYFKLTGDGGPVSDRQLTVFFSVFVLLQFWNLFNARTLGTNRSALVGLSGNPYFLMIAAAILLGQVVLVQIGGDVFRTVPLAAAEWAAIIGGTSVVLVVGELLRWRSRTTEGVTLTPTTDA